MLWCLTHAVQVVESAKANGTNNHGLDGDRLFVGASPAP
jgi:ribosomal protein L22